MNFDWILKPNGKLTLKRAKDKAPNKCQVVRCRNKKAPKMNVCYRCHRIVTRKNNYAWAAFKDLQSSARRRKKSFNLTFTQFRLLLTLKPEPDSTLDRIDPLQGYTFKNLQWLSRSENTTKQNTFDREAYRQAKILEYEKAKDEDFIPDLGFGYADEVHPDNCPF